jgi:hypothetical protein
MTVRFLLVLAGTAAAKTLPSTSTRGGAAALPHANLNAPVKASFPYFRQSRKDVLKAYPKKFIVDWDDIPTTSAAALVYHWYGIAVTTTCEVREEVVSCSCLKSDSVFGFDNFETIPERDVNTPVSSRSLRGGCIQGL